MLASGGWGDGGGVGVVVVDWGVGAGLHHCGGLCYGYQCRCELFEIEFKFELSEIEFRLTFLFGR